MKINVERRYNQLLRIEEELGENAIFAGDRGLAAGTTPPALSQK
jgi:enolase